MKNQTPLLTASKIKKTGITVILALCLIGLVGCNRQPVNEETNGKNSEAVTNEPEQIETGVDANDTNSEAADEEFVMRPEVAALPTEPFFLSPEYFDEPLFELVEKDVPEEDLEYSHITMSSEEYEKIRDLVDPLDYLEEDRVVYLRLREKDMVKVRGKAEYDVTYEMGLAWQVSMPLEEYEKVEDEVNPLYGSDSSEGKDGIRRVEVCLRKSEVQAVLEEAGREYEILYPVGYLKTYTIHLKTEKFAQIEEAVRPLAIWFDEYGGNVTVTVGESDTGKVQNALEQASIGKRDYEVKRPESNLAETLVSMFSFIYNESYNLAGKEIPKEKKLNSDFTSRYNHYKYHWKLAKKLQPIEIPDDTKNLYYISENPYFSNEKDAEREKINFYQKLSLNTYPDNLVWASKNDLEEARKKGVIFWYDRSEILPSKLYRLVLLSGGIMARFSAILIEHETREMSYIFHSTGNEYIEAYVLIPPEEDPEYIWHEIQEFGKKLTDPTSDANAKSKNGNIDYAIFSDWKNTNQSSIGDIYMFKIQRIHRGQLINLARYPNLLIFDRYFFDSEIRML